MATQETEKEHAAPEKEPAKAKNLLLAVIFGLIFGFLLQKGGAANTHTWILIHHQGENVVHMQAKSAEARAVRALASSW